MVEDAEWEAEAEAESEWDAEWEQEVALEAMAGDYKEEVIGEIIEDSV